MTQEFANQIFATDLGSQLSVIYVTSDDNAFVRRSDAEFNADNKNLKDKTITEWYPDYVENTISNSEPPSTVSDESWLETFFEISCRIGWELSQEPMPKQIEEWHESGGHCAMKNYATILTNEFQELHKYREWDGEFFDEIDKFCDEKFNEE